MARGASEVATARAGSAVRTAPVIVARQARYVVLTMAGALNPDSGTCGRGRARRNGQRDEEPGVFSAILGSGTPTRSEVATRDPRAPADRPAGSRRHELRLLLTGSGRAVKPCARRVDVGSRSATSGGRLRVVTPSRRWAAVGRYARPSHELDTAAGPLQALPAFRATDANNALNSLRVGRPAPPTSCSTGARSGHDPVRGQCDSHDHARYPLLIVMPESEAQAGRCLQSPTTPGRPPWRGLEWLSCTTAPLAARGRAP